MLLNELFKAFNDFFPMYFLGFSFILGNFLDGNDPSVVIEMARFEVLIDFV